MRLLQVGQECARYNKFMVVGASPIVVEAELKIEELGQVVACAARFEDEELESLIERSARMREDEQRVLFVINATSRQELVSARPLLERLKRAGLYFIVHTIAGAGLTVTQLGKGAMLFISPEVSPLLQPLIDAPFFFSLAVALAYGRGLTPRQIDRPRNLAKSVTTTNSEPRREVESRREFHLMSLADFAATAAQHEISPSSTYWPDAAEWKQLLIGLAKNLISMWLISMWWHRLGRYSEELR
jgi:hypothetical protein